VSKAGKEPKKKKRPFTIHSRKEMAMSSSVASIAEVQKRVREMLPSLNCSQADVLGLLSYAMLLFNSCGMTRMVNGLAQIEQVPAGRLRQRLREFYYEAQDKRGKKRRALDVSACFGSLLAAILRHWQGEKRLALALDASTLGKRFTVLSMSVLYRGCALPVAWKIIRAQQKGSWRPYWEGMLASLAGVVPRDWKVIVMADEGLYAHWLFTGIQQLGWHPMLRVHLQMKFRAQRETEFAALGKRVQRRGRGWKGKGEWSETGVRLAGTLLVRWEKGYQHALAVVTDGEPDEMETAWYTMRFWIEDEYKDHKSGGFGWQQTKMEDPKRAERLWLAMAVAMQFAVLVGGQHEATPEAQVKRKGQTTRQRSRVGRPAKPMCKPRGREQSVLVVGQECIQAAIMRGEPLPSGYVVSEPWPTQTYRPRLGTGIQNSKCKKREESRRYRQRRRARGNEADKQRAHQDKAERRKSQQQAPARRPSQPAVQPVSQRAGELTKWPAAPVCGPQLPPLPPQGVPGPLADVLQERLSRPEEDELSRQLACSWPEEWQREQAVRLLRQRHRAARLRVISASARPPASSLFPILQSLIEPGEPP
jgi:hypothetical protein